MHPREDRRFCTRATIPNGRAGRRVRHLLLNRTSPSISEIIAGPDTRYFLYECRHDQTATHILLRLVPCLTPIGTVRAYSLEGGNEYKFGRLAVLKPFRQRGFGRDLLFALHQWVQEDAKRVGAVQSTRVVCHAQLPVVEFYVK